MKKYLMIIGFIIIICPVTLAQNQMNSDKTIEEIQQELREYYQSPDYEKDKEDLFNEFKKDSNPEDVEAFRKWTELNERQYRDGENVAPEEMQKALMGMMTKDAEYTFKTFIIDPIPEGVTILSGETFQFQDTSARLEFIADKNTFTKIAEDYEMIPTGLGKIYSLRMAGGDKLNSGLTYYRRTITKAEDDQKYRRQYFLARDEQSGKTFFRYLSEGGIGLNEEWANDNEQIIQYSNGEKEILVYTFGEYDAEIKKYDAQGRLMETWNEKGDKIANKREFDESGKPREGVYKEYYDNGKIKSEGFYQDGRREGTFKGYHENGSLNFESEYKDSWPAGEMRTYHENGNLKTI
ncbi:MAG: hypothetical protein Q7S13_02355, partial [Candidatus Omnitrophota bacterium]|nr:hypothetical protein [Candidatus Omnitrophota bacterium]